MSEAGISESKTMGDKAGNLSEKKTKDDKARDITEKRILEMPASQLLTTIREELSGVGIEEAALEAWIFLEWICGIDRGNYYMNPDLRISGEMLTRVEEMVRRRKERVPLQYLMGSCDFMGYTFLVDERVLIPRQDTECLVEEALAILQQQRLLWRENYKPAVLDLCTGSGCIGISVKKMVPDAEVTLSDISGDALEVAARNADRLEAAVSLVQGDLFEHVTGKYDLILSNPPYIPEAVIDTLMPEVRDHEPELALNGSADGLEFYRRIIREAKDYLNPGGWLVFEIGMDQGAYVGELMVKEGYEQVRIAPDLAGLDRLAMGCLP